MEQHIPKPIRKQVLADALAGVQRRDEVRMQAGQGDRLADRSGAVASKVPSKPAAGDGGMDADALVRALDGQSDMLGREGVVELIDALVSGLATSVHRLRDSIASGDAAVLKRTAHTMKSNAAMLEATALSDRLDALEAAAKTGVLDDHVAIEVDAAALEYAKIIGLVGTLRSRYLQ